MPRAKPYDPSRAVHDRCATDLTRLAEVAPIEVDDPYGLEPGDQIGVVRQLRGDPLAALHSRKQISEEQYYGGRAYQRDFEAAERGPQAIDPTKEKVDGGRPPEPLQDGQVKALESLKQAHRALGQSGAALAKGFLIDRLTIEQVCQSRGLFGIREKLYIGRRIRECLNELAVIYGFATK